MTRCPICGETHLDVVYKGPIRVGRFGVMSDRSYSVPRCLTCDTAWLEGDFFDYTQPDYREQVDGDSTIEEYQRIHDGDQARALDLVGTEGLRGLVVADIGSGGGSFLDMVKGFASNTLAIEPARFYHDGLKKNGHSPYASLEQALTLHAGKVDLAVCLSVIEHVDDPVQLLGQAKQLLKPGGRLVVSTPNRADWLLQLSPKEYGSFFYRCAHRWYLTANSLREIASRAGFDKIQVHHRHRFGLSNLMLWLRDKRPTGQDAVPVPAILDATFRSALNEAGLADYLYADLISGCAVEGD